MMDRLRRFAGLLLGLLLLQTSLLGTGLACASPSDATLAGTTGKGMTAAPHADAAGSVIGPQDGGHGHTAHAPASTSIPVSERESGTQHHGGQLHCLTASSCTSAAVASVSPAVPDPGKLAGARVAAVITVPASVVGTPEPPPPRARV